MSAGVAQANPSFNLAESQARAGDVVHFTITGGDDEVTYDFELADHDVVKGAGDGDAGPVSGQFTMPDLGSSAKSVQVKAEIRDDDDDKTTVKRTLQYLGRAQTVTTPAAPQSVTAPAAAPQPAPAAQGPHLEQAQETRGAIVERRRKRARRRHARERRADERQHDRFSKSKGQEQS
jgi:hypothetical protein